jgi:dTDP-L-rhamnose 4-epimerase
MAKNILVTGGAGFIGSHLVDQLLAAGHRVRVLDNLAAQVHGPMPTWPAYLDRRADLMEGDVRDAVACRRALAGVEVVYHLAASVGVGQSMYQVADYTDVNNRGTAVLLEQVVTGKRVQKLLVASSMSVYGEGLYRDGGGALVELGERAPAALKARQWDPVDQQGFPLVPLPTPESKRPALASVYALSKYDQERLCLIMGRAYGIPTVALRLFNVYGPRQALSNPYTGVLAIFASRLLNERPPLINEDGQQRRDFVSVHDVARAFVRALDAEATDGLVANVGSGQSYTIREIAERVAAVLGSSISASITGSHRAGDIRHCFADITAARRTLDWQPQVSLSDGLGELATWLRRQAAAGAAVDRLEAARAELQERGLAS